MAAAKKSAMTRNTKASDQSLKIIPMNKPTMRRKELTVNQARAVREQFFQELIHNEVLNRRQWMKQLTDPRRDIDNECGYPVEISTELREQYYERHGIAARVVNFYPEECWKSDPEVYEKEESEETPWEKRWGEIVKQFAIYTVLERIDKLSGVGRYGVLLIGIDDAKPLSEPADGFDKIGRPLKTVTGRNIIYLQCYKEKDAKIIEIEKNTSSTRYGKPLMYQLMMGDPVSGMTQATSIKVHWTRVLHVADDRSTSDIIGGSRLDNVFNPLYDLKKIGGGSAEMFWKGGFPGLSFEVDPNLAGQVEIDKDSIKQEMSDYANSLSRYMSSTGVKVNSLSPQVASPREHFDIAIETICITKSIPKRSFMGSEQGELASDQDKGTLNERLMRRNNRYVVPFVLRSFIDHLMAIGVMPWAEEYFTEFPDLEAPSEKDIAEIAERTVNAMAKYISAGCDSLMHPIDFLMIVFKYTQEQAEAVLEKAEERIASEERFVDLDMEDQKEMVDVQQQSKDRSQQNDNA